MCCASCSEKLTQRHLTFPHLCGLPLCRFISLQEGLNGRGNKDMTKVRSGLSCCVGVQKGLPSGFPHNERFLLISSLLLVAIQSKSLPLPKYDSSSTFVGQLFKLYFIFLLNTSQYHSPYSSKTATTTTTNQLQFYGEVYVKYMNLKEKLPQRGSVDKKKSQLGGLIFVQELFKAETLCNPVAFIFMQMTQSRSVILSSLVLKIHTFHLRIVVFLKTLIESI